MKIMYILLTIIILIVGILYIGETQITLKPFSFKMVAYLKLIGFLLVGIGIGLIQHDAGQKAVNNFKVELIQELEQLKAKEVEPKTEEIDNQ